MRINPNHPNLHRPQDAPRKSGDRLPTFERHVGEELWVNLTEFIGNPPAWPRR